MSTSDAINFKLIHYEAAIAVIQALREKIAQPAADAVLNELSIQLCRLVTMLRDKQSANLSFDDDAVKLDIGGKHKRSKLTDIFGNFRREKTALVQTGTQGDGLPESTRHVHIRTALACLIHGRIRGLGDDIEHLSIEDLDRQIFQQYVDLLQSKEWNTIEIGHALKFPETDGGTRCLLFKTTMTPAKKMDGVLAKNYQNDGVNGICSYAIHEQRHAVNLWRTEFRPDGLDHNQTPLVFSGLRHGVHDAYGICEPAHRQAANDARTREFLHAALLDHLKRNDLKVQEIDTNKTLEIDIVSINLLTTFGKEMAMIEQQQSAFSRVTGEEIRIVVADESGQTKEIGVKPRIIMFSTPVDYLALSKAADLIGIWRTADSINKIAIKTLIGSIRKNEPVGGIVGACIARLESELASSRKIQLISELVTEIREIFATHSHHQVGNEPYKLPTRLLALANETGLTAAYNCKSGKDRTGQLNVEIRDFYAHLNATGGQLRKVNTKREGLARENFQKLFIAGGDREIQALNTGAAGSKSQLPYYNKLMGIKPKTIDEIRGLSKWVGT